MEAIVKYKAIDGVEFNTVKECDFYEEIILSVKKIMSPLYPRPNDISYSNGKGFVQHDLIILKSVKINLLKEMQKHIEHHWIQETIDKEVDPSWVGRIVGEWGIRPLSDAWYRFSCTDKTGKEWGQPYYASNPDKGQQILINK